MKSDRHSLHRSTFLSCIFFQGLEDKVVPPNQAEMMVEALKAKGLPVAMLLMRENNMDSAVPRILNAPWMVSFTSTPVSLVLTR
jgi:hypothetical protein